MKIRYLVVFIALTLPLSMFSQEFRGTISGVVTDATGGTIAGAKVAVTETHTNTRVDVVTESTGQYTAAFLLPGDYDIAAKTPGFKEYIRKGVHVGAGEHPVIDFEMEVGDTSQAVTVTAEVPLVESSTGSTAQVITTEEVEDFPLNGLTPMMLGRLAMGVISTNEPGPVRPFDNGAASSFTMGGTAAQTSEILINGAPNAGFSRQMAYSPPQGAVTEVRAYSFESDAAFGHTGGGTVGERLQERGRLSCIHSHREPAARRDRGDSPLRRRQLVRV